MIILKIILAIVGVIALVFAGIAAAVPSPYGSNEDFTGVAIFCGAVGVALLGVALFVM